MTQLQIIVGTYIMQAFCVGFTAICVLVIIGSCVLGDYESAAVNAICVAIQAYLFSFLARTREKARRHAS